MSEFYYNSTRGVTELEKYKWIRVSITGKLQIVGSGYIVPTKKQLKAIEDIIVSPCINEKYKTNMNNKLKEFLGDIRDSN